MNKKSMLEEKKIFYRNQNLENYILNRYNFPEPRIITCIGESVLLYNKGKLKNGDISMWGFVIAHKNRWKCLYTEDIIDWVRQYVIKYGTRLPDSKNRWLEITEQLYDNIVNPLDRNFTNIIEGIMNYHVWLKVEPDDKFFGPCGYENNFAPSLYFPDFRNNIAGLLSSCATIIFASTQKTGDMTISGTFKDKIPKDAIWKGILGMDTKDIIDTYDQRIDEYENPQTIDRIEKSIQRTVDMRDNCRINWHGTHRYKKIWS